MELDWSGYFMKRYSQVLTLFLGASMLAAAQAPVASVNGKPDAIEAYLQPLAQNHMFAGAVALVANRDRVVYLKAVGYRDIERKAPMTTDDLFWIASTSKPIAATALMMLVDEGKVNVDDPVEKYLPEFHGQMVSVTHAGATDGVVGAASQPSLIPANHPILVREILSHTSGLPFKSKAQPDALDTLPLKDAVLSFAAEPLMFQPNTDYSYSNEGLDTVARIIEVVSGIPYEQFLQERLFDPLGMKDTTFWPSAEQIRRLAKAYKLDAQTKTLTEVPISQLTYPLDDRQRRYPMPAGGLFSTAEDLSKFCRMILNGGVFNGKRIISLNALQEMTSRQNGGLGGTSYGFGWGVSTSGFEHGGALKNAMEIDPAKGRMLVFMVQQDGPWGTTEGDAIDSTLERLADGLVASHAAVSSASGSSPAALKHGGGMRHAQMSLPLAILPRTHRHAPVLHAAPLAALSMRSSDSAGSLTEPHNVFASRVKGCLKNVDANENGSVDRVRRGAEPNAACSAKVVHPDQTYRRSFVESPGCRFHRSAIPGGERTAASIPGRCSGRLHCHGQPTARATLPLDRRVAGTGSGLVAQSLSRTPPRVAASGSERADSCGRQKRSSI
jgi:CubicO group peptidase (beta-lactamase class C family)